MVRVLPRAKRNQVAGEWDGALKVCLTAAPVAGKANEALITFLVKTLRIARSNITIVRGETSRMKTISVLGLDAPRVAQCFGLECTKSPGLR